MAGKRAAATGNGARVGRAARRRARRHCYARPKAIAAAGIERRWPRMGKDIDVDVLIPTKIAPPVWMGDQVRRELLLSRLDGALARRLTLVHAPAGYGKTSLLAQWRQRHDDGSILTAWLTLERDDSDLKRLARYVTLAMNGGVHGDDDAAGGTGLPPRAALSAIVRQVASERRPVVLVFDDFHRAESPALAEFLGSLIRLAPENCHFIVASRDYPMLGQSVLAAEDQVLELTAEDLRFSACEAQAMFARGQGPAIDSADVQRILERTEGWPIALQLAFLSLRRGLDPGRLLAGLSGSGSELARYLSEQVLVGLPADMQEAVLRTALVDRLDGDVASLLCARADGWQVLERLEQQGVFLIPHPGEGQAYRYHQLFAECMRERLARQDRALFVALQGDAARWFAGRGHVTEAVNHALQAEDEALLAGILEDAGAWRLIPRGLQNVAARGLERLSDAAVSARPRLVLARVYLAIKRGELGAARADYDRLAAAMEAERPPAGQANEIRIVGDVLAEYENAPVTLEDLLARESLLRTLPSSDHLMLGNVCESLGAKYYEGGWLERAMEPTLAAREHHQAQGSLYSDLFTRFLEARIRRAQGRLKEATAILDEARAQIAGHFGDRSDLAANCAAFEADLLCEQDRLAEAAALLEWSLPHMEQSDGWVDVYAAAYLTAARIACARGAMEEAQAVLARARRLARRRRLDQLELLAWLCELQLRLRHDGAGDGARELAAQLGLDALADEMARESAVYRQVAIAASLCRCELALLEGEVDAALAELAALRRWASRHGAGRLLIEVDLLAAHGLLRSGEAAAAQARFDEAVGMAMFQGIARPFVDAWHRIEPLVRDALHGGPQGDRFREQFLKGLARSVPARPPAAGAAGLLSEAELAVLEPLCRGRSNKEIARLIGMSPDTVKYRLKSLFRKIGVSKRRDAVRVLRERGLVAGEDAPAPAGDA
ncbi:helix-turn-helix transcriptional regulator [Pseudoxanthomonas broegbernensis]|nr:LuxR C-terminal-related transcriptional regulator [Pseudoxanthomonas broegbernensis]